MPTVNGIVIQFAFFLTSPDIAAAELNESVLVAHAHAVQLARLRSEPTPDVFCIATNCILQTASCVADTNCRTALGCSTQEHGRFQCISDYGNDVYDELVYCMFNQHDCMGTKNTFDPYQMCRALDQAGPMTTYRGQPLTYRVARRLLMRGTNHRGDWFVALGKSGAFDCFDCQYFYWGYKPDQSMYYSADYKIHKSNGDIRWQTSESIASEWPETAGRYSVIAPNDNGLYREDDWRMLAVDESRDVPTWVAMYYCGGVPGVANAYEGAMVLTPDGQVPPGPEMNIIDAVFAKANITLKCKTDNSNCTGSPEPPSTSSTVAV